MAYAKLVFPVGTYSLAKLKEIARFATGQISSTADLQHASAEVSEIVISDAPGWSLQSGQTFEAQGTATISEYRLQAPCVDTSKVKYGLLSIKDRREIYQVGTSSAYTSAIYSVSVGSTSTVGFLNFQLGSSFSGTTLQNPTYRLNYVFANNYWPGLAPKSTISAQIIGPGPSIESNTIYVFVSARKLICVIPEASGRCDMASILEFPENQSTMRQSNLPAAAFTARYLSVASPNDPINELYNNTNNTYPSYNIYYSFQLVSWYNNILGTRVNRNVGSYGLTNSIAQPAPVSLNVTSSGQQAYPLIPMTNNRIASGEGIHDYSALSDMYITYRTSTYASQGDTVSVSGVNYVVLQIGDSTSNYRALAIKMG